MSAEEQEAWEARFTEMDDDLLFSVMQLSNELQVRSLLDLACKTVADMIKACQTPQEIRRRFNIVNDFTPEEEEQIHQENGWTTEN